MQSFRGQPISILMDLALTFLVMVRNSKRETREERVFPTYPQVATFTEANSELWNQTENVDGW